MKHDKTDKGPRILAFIRQYARDNTFTPTMREITSAVGLSSVSVTSYNLKKLQEAGEIDLVVGTYRNIRLKDSVTLTFTGDDAHVMREYLSKHTQSSIVWWAQSWLAGK